MSVAVVQDTSDAMALPYQTCQQTRLQTTSHVLPASDLLFAPRRVPIPALAPLSTQQPSRQLRFDRGSMPWVATIHLLRGRRGNKGRTLRTKVNT